MSWKVIKPNLVTMCAAVKLLRSTKYTLISLQQPLNIYNVTPPPKRAIVLDE